MPDSQDTVAVWSVPLHDRVHKIEFEHSTTTGKRVIRVDGKEILRKDWMFKLVGKNLFNIGKTKCAISVEALGTFAYEYTLEINGKMYDKFREELKKKLQSWSVVLDGNETHICLDKGTMDVWVNGQKVDTAGEFVDNGTKTHFEIGNNVCYVKATSSGKKKVGFIYQLYVNNSEVPLADNSIDTSTDFFCK